MGLGRAPRKAAGPRGNAASRAEVPEASAPRLLSALLGRAWSCMSLQGPRHRSWRRGHGGCSGFE